MPGTGVAGAAVHPIATIKGIARGKEGDAFERVNSNKFRFPIYFSIISLLVDNFLFSQKHSKYRSKLLVSLFNERSALQRTNKYNKIE